MRPQNKVPVHFIRYESLLEEPEQALTDLFKFLLNKESLEGHEVSVRISKACRPPDGTPFSSG
jgi:hypothetical protein